MDREQILQECRTEGNNTIIIDDADIRTLIGKTMVSVENTGDEIVFTTDKGSVYALYHESDCCESVYVEDVCGDLDDLVGTSLWTAEEVSSEDRGPVSEYDDSYTWTFYKFSTITSNGYYSESVIFRKEFGSSNGVRAVVGYAVIDWWNLLDL